MDDADDARRLIRGEFLLSDYCERTGRLTPVSGWIANTLLYSWGTIAASRLFLADSPLTVNTLYLEYENVADPADPATVPDFGRDAGIADYAALASSPSRDYLRVPLLAAPSFDVAPGYEPYIAPDAGNRAVAFALSTGTVGVTGKPFSDSVNSKLSGLALVAAPSRSDPTRDVLLSRKYYPVEKQRLKQAGFQLGVTYRVLFG